MPYPMVPGSIYERWYKSIEEKVGLPMDLIKRLDSTHYSFYLQNKDKIKIEEHNKEISFTILDNNLGKEIYEKIYGFEPIGSDIGHFFFGENDIDKYLDIIGFRVPERDNKLRIDGIPESRFITSKEINKEMNRLFGN